MTNENPTFDRRQFLKASGLAASAGFAVPTVKAASPDSEIVRVKGSWNDPISVEELQQTKYDAVKRHRRRGNDHPDYFVDAVPEFSDGGRIVDYVVQIQPDGQPRQFVGVAGGPESVRATHQDAGAAQTEFETTTDSISTQQTVDSQWNRITDDQATYKKCPYGEVKHNFVWWKLGESYDDAGEDLHAVKQIASMTPGDDDSKDVSPCDSDAWHNEWMMVKNDWDQSEIANPALHDWDPYDTDANTVDVDLSATTSDAGLVWSFDNNGSIQYYVSGNRVRWELHGLYNKERNTTQTMKPGSVCKLDEPACDVKNKLTYLRMEGHFEDSWTNKHYLYYYWNLNYTRYC